MPDETKVAYFQMILPKHWESQKIKPVCLHLAGTGDHVSIFLPFYNCYLFLLVSIQFLFSVFLEKKKFSC